MKVLAEAPPGPACSPEFGQAGRVDGTTMSRPRRERYRVTDASDEEGSGGPFETAAHERDNGLRGQENKDAGRFSGLEYHRRRRQRGRSAA